MASGYALPTAASAGSFHGHSHSFSGSSFSSPERKTSKGFSNSNGGTPRKAISTNGLFTHAETSRETSPIPSPQPDQFPTFEQNIHAVRHNHHHHGHQHTRSWSPIKSRQRGDSDLGDATFATSRVVSTSGSTTFASWLSLPEALTSLLVPLPYVLASATFSSMYGGHSGDFPPLALYQQEKPQDGVDARSSGIFETCALVSGALLMVGAVGKVQQPTQTLDRRKGSHASGGVEELFSLAAIRTIALRSISLALPLYASMQLGGTRVGLVLLIALAAGLNSTGSLPRSIDLLKSIWSSKVASTGVIVLAFICDEAGLTIFNSLTGVLLGYLALILAVAVLPLPFPGALDPYESPSRARPGPESASRVLMSQLIRSDYDTNITLAAGLALAILTALAAFLGATSNPIATFTILLGLSTAASLAASITLSIPSSLTSQRRAGLALGCLTTASCSFLFSPSLWPGTICNGGLAALSFLSILYDTNPASSHGHSHDHHDHAHHVHTHHHHKHQSKEGVHSVLTRFFLSYCEPGSLMYTILSEKDSRRIAYFTTLNFGFMIVQGVYGYLSGSLGLLSDTVHMFFDCLGLVVGLGAAVASKWPTSADKPYGWGKLNTLAGFGNGVFLMLVSVEFVWEAIEGILDQRELRHVQELLVVSTLGLLVNMVGLFAFGHAHAGHDHGHSHSHGHGSGHDHSHANGHAHDHHCDHDHDSAQKHSHGHAEHHSGGHDRHNDNMHGIFLHVAADAGGSLAVIISTALTLWHPWYLWDPLATIIIAVLIFAAAVPLVTSSGQKLLLVIPEDLEYSIKNTLQGLGEVRGVIGYAAPRFWLDDKEDSGDAHGHHHHHDHGHDVHAGKQKVQGVVHVIAVPFADVEDVRQRVEEYTRERNMDLVIHVEREADGPCWCGGAGAKAG